MAQAQQTSARPELERERPIEMSYEDYLTLDEGLHAEWVRGDVTIFMSAETAHQRIVAFLFPLMAFYARRLDLGEVYSAPYEMRLEAVDSSREPDILFVSRDHLDRISKKRLDGPADLAIELVSEWSVARDRSDKFDEYEEAGVPEYLIIDTRPGRERFDAYQLAPTGKYRTVLPDADGRYHSSALPGFWLKPEWLWRDPLPDPLEILFEIMDDVAPEAMRRRPSGSA